jgi:hypothetical protein
VLSNPARTADESAIARQLLMPRDNTLIQLIKKEDVNGSAVGSDFGEASLRVFCATVLGKQPDQPCELGAYSLCEEGGRVMWL